MKNRVSSVVLDRGMDAFLNNNNNNNNNNSILYYLCAESRATKPITGTAQCRYK
jgi:hypothetical protein